MKVNLSRVFLLFVYICIGDPIIKMECWNQITRLDFASSNNLTYNASTFTAVNAEQLPLFGIH